MPWIDKFLHVTFAPGAEDLPPEEIEAELARIREDGRIMCEQREAAAKALEGLPYAAVPLEQLASIYERFLRLTRLGQSSIDDWSAMSESEAKVRHAIFAQSDFGAVFAGQWLPNELREATRLKSREPVEGEETDAALPQS